MTTENPSHQKRLPPPKGGWPRAEFVPNRGEGQPYRCRKMVAGRRWTEWGSDPEDALDAWKAWWNAGCPTRDQLKQRSTCEPALDDDPDATPPVTVAELFDRFLVKRKSSLARSTHKRYERDIRLRLKPQFGHKAFPLDRPAIVRWEESLEAANMATTSIRRRMTVLQSAFAWAIKQGWLMENPAARIAMPKSRPRVSAQQTHQVAPPPLDIPTVDEVRSFLRAAKAACDPLYPLWSTGFRIGPRPGELVAMSEGQLLLGPSGLFQFVAVRQKLVRGDSTPAIKDLNGRIISTRIVGELILEAPKWGSDRDIELDPDDPLLEILITQAELMRQLAQRARLGPEVGRHALPAAARWSPRTRRRSLRAGHAPGSLQQGRGACRVAQGPDAALHAALRGLESDPAGFQHEGGVPDPRAHHVADVRGDVRPCDLGVPDGRAPERGDRKPELGTETSGADGPSGGPSFLNAEPDAVTERADERHRLRHDPRTPPKKDEGLEILDGVVQVMRAGAQEATNEGTEEQVGETSSSIAPVCSSMNWGF